MKKKAKPGDNPTPENENVDVIDTNANDNTVAETRAEIRDIIKVYKDPPGEVGQLELLMAKVSEKRDELRQKRRDIEETLAELDNVEEACLTRLAEIGVGT